MSKREYIELADDVIKQMDKEIGQVKVKNTKQPWIDKNKLSLWVGRITMGLFALGFFYNELWPEVEPRLRPYYKDYFN